jgi:hypothetical protein
VQLVCSIKGCEEAHYGKGFCSKHYQRLVRHGSVLETQLGSLEERFKKKFAEAEGCWEWQGARSTKGYGVIQEAGRGSRLLLAHRVSYQIHRGEIPNGKLVLHSCHNRGCVNPSHLRSGTQSENIREAFDAKRKVQPIAFGEQNPKSKLTLAQAKFIKAHPEMQHTELAALFGLSPNCIRGVRIGRTWKDA